MSLKLIVPSLGESITEATVSKWLKGIGESFEIDEPLVEIETDKITVEVPAPKAGTLSEIRVKEGSDINIGGVLGIIGESKSINKIKNDQNNNSKQKEEKIIVKANEILKQDTKQQNKANQDISKLSPSVKKMIQEKNIKVESIITKRDDGRITKEDIIKHLEITSSLKKNKSDQREEIVPMSKIRQTIASRLKDSQNTAAILTTFTLYFFPCS